MTQHMFTKYFAFKQTQDLSTHTKLWIDFNKLRGATEILKWALFKTFQKEVLDIRPGFMLATEIPLAHTIT